MPLILKSDFISLVNHLKTTIQEEDVPSHYIGMGNPDSDTLIVGKEIALGELIPEDAPIIFHEHYQNINHWYDIISHYLHLVNSLDLKLISRTPPLSGFNPFSPMLFPLTAQRVISSKRHTYYLIERLINFGKISELSINTKSTFHHCFLTEINTKPARNNANYNPNENSSNQRRNFIQNTPFYKTFKTVIIHTGLNLSNYIGARRSDERYTIIRDMFNPGITNNPTTILLGTRANGTRIEVDIYNNDDNNTKVILCNQLSGTAGWTNIALDNFNGLL